MTESCLQTNINKVYLNVLTVAVHVLEYIAEEATVFNENSIDPS